MFRKMKLRRLEPTSFHIYLAAFLVSIMTCREAGSSELDEYSRSGFFIMGDAGLALPRMTKEADKPGFDVDLGAGYRASKVVALEVAFNLTYYMMEYSRASTGTLGESSSADELVRTKNLWLNPKLGASFYPLHGKYVLAPSIGLHAGFFHYKTFYEDPDSEDTTKERHWNGFSFDLDVGLDFYVTTNLCLGVRVTAVQPVIVEKQDPYSTGQENEFGPAWHIDLGVTYFFTRSE